MAATMREKLQILLALADRQQANWEALALHIRDGLLALSDGDDDSATQEARAARKLTGRAAHGTWSEHVRDLRNGWDEPAGDLYPFPRDWTTWEPTAEEMALITAPAP